MAVKVSKGQICNGTTSKINVTRSKICMKSYIAIKMMQYYATLLEYPLISSEMDSDKHRCCMPAINYEEIDFYMGLIGEK